VTAFSRLVAEVGGVALFLLAGFGLVAWIPALRRRSLLVRTGWAYLLGLASAGALIFLGNHALGFPLKRTLVLGVLLLVGVPGLVRLCRKPDAVARSASRHAILLKTALVIGSVVFVGVFAESATNVVSDWDGQMTWIPTARWMRAERTVDASILEEPKWYVSHPQYPPLMALAQISVEEIFDTTDDTRLIRPLYASFFAAWLLVLFDSARRRAGTRAAALVALVAALVPWIAFGRWYGGAMDAFSDMPLACFWGAGLLLLLERGRSVSAGMTAGLLLAAGALTKNEGTPLALLALGVAGAGTLLEARRRSGTFGWRPLAAAALPVAIALLVLASWRSGIPNRYDEDYGAQLRKKGVVAEIWNRLPLLPSPIWKKMRDPAAWGSFWYVAPLVGLAGAGALRRRPARPLAAAVCGGLAMFVLAYGVTPWGGTLLVEPTCNRFLLQLSLPGLVLLAMALAECFAAVARWRVPPPRAVPA
jgi:hypothetical protein